MFHLCFSLQPRLSHFPLSLMEDLKSKPSARFPELGVHSRHPFCISLALCLQMWAYIFTYSLSNATRHRKEPSKHRICCWQPYFGYLNSTCCSGSIESLLFHSQVFSCGFASPFCFLSFVNLVPVPDEVASCCLLCRAPFWWELDLVLTCWLGISPSTGTLPCAAAALWG